MEKIVICALITVCGTAMAYVDPAYLEIAGATGGEVMDVPREVMAAGDAPVSLDNYFSSVEFVQPSNNPLTPHVNEIPIKILRSGPRKLHILLRDHKQIVPKGIVFLDAQTQSPNHASIQFEILSTTEIYCHGIVEVPKHAFYIAVSYPTPSGQVLRIYPKIFKPVF